MTTKIDIVILSPSSFSPITAMTIQRLSSVDGVNIIAVIHKKLSLKNRLKDELRVGLLSFLKKLTFKLFLPLIKNITSRKKPLLKNYIELKCSNFNEGDIVDFVQSTAPDLIVFTGGGIIREQLIASSRLGILNCHIGILPEFRGMYPNVWAILKNRFDLIGCTTHLMDNGIDTGPIFKHYRFDLLGTPFSQLTPFLEHQIPACIEDTVTSILYYDLKATNQKHNDGLQYFIPHKKILATARDLYNEYHSI